MKLVADWKTAWRWFSIHVAAVATVVGAVQQAMPSFCPAPVAVGSLCETATHLMAPSGWLMATFGIAMIVARLTNQGTA